MATIETLTTLAIEAKTYYDKVLLERALPELVHGQFGQTFVPYAREVISKP